jgi:hypothetical protein
MSTYVRLYAFCSLSHLIFQHSITYLLAHFFKEETVLGQNDFKLTQELHVIRAHLLYYESLLNNFKQSVEFVRDTPNCAITPEQPGEQRSGEENSKKSKTQKSKELLKKECDILIDQLARLEKDRQMQDMRLRNVTNLVSLILFMYS